MEADKNVYNYLSNLIKQQQYLQNLPLKYLEHVHKIMQSPNNYQIFTQSILQQVSYFAKVLQTQNVHSSILSQVAQMQKLINASKSFSTVPPKIPDYLLSYTKFLAILDSPAATKALSTHFEKLPSEFEFVESQVAVDESEPECQDNQINEIVIENKNSKEKLSVVNAINVFGSLDIIRSITEKDAADFYSFLAKFPMLGLSHKVGKSIWKELASRKKENFFASTGISLFRGRPWEEDQKRPFAETEMINAPFNLPEQGRCNVRGQSHLYTCDKLEAAAVEARNSGEGKLQIIEWTLKKKLKLLNLADLDCPLIEFCEFAPNDVVLKFEPAYSIMNFITQCCQKLNISGIRYKSNKYPGAICYVFFYDCSRWLKYKNMHYVEPENP